MPSRRSASARVRRAGAPPGCTPTRATTIASAVGRSPDAASSVASLAAFARRGIESSQRMGRHRRAVEHTLAGSPNSAAWPSVT